MRTKAILIVVLVLLLAGAGIFSVLIKTGKLGSKADVIDYTYSFSGQILDSESSQPIPEVDILVLDGQSNILSSTKTDGNGLYNATGIYQSSNQSLYLYSLKDGYPFDTPPQTISVANKGNIVLAAQLTKLTPKSLDCHGLFITYGGVDICLEGQVAESIIQKKPRAISEISSTINHLRSLTGKSQIPKTVFVIDNLESSGAAYFINGYHYISIDSGSVLKADITWTSDVIRHEYGHNIDRYYGHLIDQPFISFSHNSQLAYKNISNVMLYYNKVPYNNVVEFFADFFEPITDQYKTKNEKLIYLIENYMLMNSEAGFAGGYFSSLNPSTRTHNSLMYYYKFVAKFAGMDQYFPGELGNDPLYDNYDADIMNNGKYMKVGVASIRLKDHTGRLMEKQTVGVAGNKILTRLKKDSGVFSDGSGDLFDTTGTAVSLNSGVGDNKLVDIPVMVSYYQGAGWLGQKVNVIRGSNPVMNFGFIYHRDMTMRIPGGSRLGGEGLTAYIESSTISGRKINPLVKGKMTRYPNLGSDDPTKTYSFYVIGGDPGRKESFSLAQLDAMRFGGKTIFINLKNFGNYNSTTRTYEDITGGVEKDKTCTWDFGKPASYTIPYTKTCVSN